MAIPPYSLLINPTQKPINFLSPPTLNPKTHLPKLTCKVSIKPPPPGFDFRSSQISTLSRSAIAESHPELLDLADMGCLVLVKKEQFGPAPAWRAEFVEPDEIWLVGTTHIDRASSLNVDRVVRALRPDNVVVELCRSRLTHVQLAATDENGKAGGWGARSATLLQSQSPVKRIGADAFFGPLYGPFNITFIFRAGIMYTSSSSQPGNQLKSNMFSLSGSEFFGAVGRSINLGGQTALALRILLAVFSSKISSDVDRPFGDEFRVARILSEEIGAQVVLGDRPIEITLDRAWNSLKWAEKLSLVGSVVRGITSSSDTSRDNVKELGTDDSSYQLYEKLSSAYPSLIQPLIHERDTYLAWSLKRSKAVNNCKRVVGVIGKGHMNGVIYALVSDQGNLRFRDLAGKKAGGADAPNAWISKFLKDLARDTLIGILLWALYEQLKSGF